MDPFLTPTQFANMFPRALTADETLVAAQVLQVASNWIWSRIPDIAYDDPAAITVTFEATRDTILYGIVNRLDEFENVTAHRTESGKVSDAMVEQFITDRHARMLGISLKAMPSYNFRPPRRPVGSSSAVDEWEYM